MNSPRIRLWRGFGRNAWQRGVAMIALGGVGSAPVFTTRYTQQSSLNAYPQRCNSSCAPVGWRK